MLRHVTRQIETLQREVYKGFNLVRERAFEGEPFEVNEQDWGEAGKGELFGCFAQGFAVRAVPVS